MESYSKQFEAWWKAYPRKVGKRAAFQKWKSAIKEIANEYDFKKQEAVDWLQEKTEAFANSPVASGEYCPHPKTWLYQGRYDDDPAEWGTAKSGIEMDPNKAQEWRP